MPNAATISSQDTDRSKTEIDGAVADSTAPGWLHVPYEGRDVLVFDEAGELLVRLFRAGRYGLRLLAIETPGASG